jgi:hypothetical protein
LANEIATMRSSESGAPRQQQVKQVKKEPDAGALRGQKAHERQQQNADRA